MNERGPGRHILGGEGPGDCGVCKSLNFIAFEVRVQVLWLGGQLAQPWVGEDTPASLELSCRPRGRLTKSGKREPHTQAHGPPANHMASRCLLHPSFPDGPGCDRTTSGGQVEARGKGSGDFCLFPP